MTGSEKKVFSHSLFRLNTLSCRILQHEINGAYMGLRITKVYTKTGDKGETRLGGGQTVPKDHVRIQAYGTVDELNSVIGLVLAFQPVEETKQALTKIQH